jgi:hypothetical protein
MAREHLVAVGAGAASALLDLSPLLGVAPGSLILRALGPLPVLAVGLGMGLAPATLAAVSGAVVIAVATQVTTAGGWYVLTTVAPTLLVLYFALQSRAANGGRRWYPSGHVLAWLTVLGVLYVVGAVVYFSGAEGGHTRLAFEFLRDYLTRLMGGLEVPPGAAAEPPAARIEAFARRISPYLLGIWVVFWALLVIGNAVLAQGLLVRFNRNLRPSTPLAAIEVPRWLAGVAAGAAVLSFVPGAIGNAAQNALLVLTIPFFFLGLAVIHAFARRWRGAGFLRALFFVLFYVVILTMVWPAFVLVGIGIVDLLANIRRRLGRRRPEEEEE